ncbi:uncharacterized protein LOC110888484 [Helianthus annuus]|uniref:uncharacterized protein LOC110888484 n=1 Tax=Helianthus annuus TaxID=4232 RepID=UPI000B9059FE|nr:uncharacterized protein LOC110888484 [Helianthus annuus]
MGCSEYSNVNVEDRVKRLQRLLGLQHLLHLYNDACGTVALHEARIKQLESTVADQGAIAEAKSPHYESLMKKVTQEAELKLATAEMDHEQAMVSFREGIKAPAIVSLLQARIKMAYGAKETGLVCPAWPVDSWAAKLKKLGGKAVPLPAEAAFILKIDIEKAYDSINWVFIEKVLEQTGFPGRWRMWVRGILTSARASELINGSPTLEFQCYRGVRQGDPLSPFSLKLTHLCFADDLFIFCGADIGSVKVIKDALNEFSSVSDLVPNMNKSDVIFGNVDEKVQKLILDILPFRVGVFPMKYLGIPLSSKRLYQKDCKALIDRVKGRISDWKVKFLSFAGRVQLIKSVLSSITIYWSSLYILPVAISEEIERLLCGFLWSQGRGNKGMARVKWEEICMAKCQGGLNISSLKIQNIALMSKRMWNVLSNKDSLWVRWVGKYKLCGKSFWEVSETSVDSWSWRQILQHRSMFREKLYDVIDNGKGVRAWLDLWHEKGILLNSINRRDIKTAGFTMNTRLVEIFYGKEWKLPQDSFSKYPWLVSSNIHQYNALREDKFMWKMENGKLEEYAVKRVYKTLCMNGPKVLWSSAIWFSQNIPKHAFILWLAFKFRLLTQDRLLKWGYEGDLRCALCRKCPDSHRHLFFECEYALAVWRRCKVFGRMNDAPNSWPDIIRFVEEKGLLNSVWGIIGKLVLAASVYFIWQERNCRHFGEGKRSVQQLCGTVFETVRMRLLGLCFKDTPNVRMVADIWGFEVKTKGNGINLNGVANVGVG